MNSGYFDSLSRSLTIAPTRRTILLTVGGGLIGLAGLHAGEDDSAAKRAGRKRRQRKRRQKRQDRDDGDQPPPPPPPPAPLVRADARCFGSSDVDFGAAENTRLAQTFTALSSGALVRAEIAIAKFEDALDEWFLRVSPVDANGRPTDDILAESVVSDANVPLGPSTIVAFPFTSPASVVAGTTYALVLFRGEFFFWGKRDGDICPGSGFLSSDESPPFITTDGDFIYTTFVSS